MAAYDLYGCKTSSISEAKDRLEKCFGFHFKCGDSSYQGGKYFYYGDKAAEHFVLKMNVDPFDGEPVEMKFSEYMILFYINATSRSAELHELIGEAQDQFPLLRHEDF